MQIKEQGFDLSILLPQKEATVPSSEVFSTVLNEYEKKDKPRQDLKVSDFLKSKNTKQELKATDFSLADSEEKIEEDPATNKKNKETKKSDIANINENNFIIHVPSNFLNLKDILLFIKEKISEIIARNQDFYKTSTFLIKFEKNVFPLELKVSKIESKYAITIFSTGTLKEDLNNNLASLINHLKTKGIDLANISVEEFNRPRDDDGSKKKNRDSYAKEEEIDLSEINKVIEEI